MAGRGRFLAELHLSKKGTEMQQQQTLLCFPAGEQRQQQKVFHQSEFSTPKNNQQTENEEFPAQLEIPSLDELQFKEDSECEADKTNFSSLHLIPCIEEEEEELHNSPSSNASHTPTEKIEVLTNFLRLLRTPGYGVFLYQLKVEPETVILDSRSVRQILDSKQLQRHLGTSPFMFGDKFYLPRAVPTFSLFPIAHPNADQGQQQLRVTIIFIKVGDQL